MIINLVRIESSEEGTFGTMTAPGLKLATAELPWEANARGESCIPTGQYLCTWHNSPKFGNCYHVNDVPGRTHVLIHSGNFAGNEPNWQSDVEGCILVGRKRGVMPNKKSKIQRCVLASKEALAALHAYTNKNDFQLKIVGVVG